MKVHGVRAPDLGLPGENKHAVIQAGSALRSRKLSGIPTTGEMGRQEDVT